MWPFKSKAVAKIRRYADKVKMRLYNAAKTEEYWSAWGKSIVSIDQAIHEDLSKLVARSREQYANNDYVRRFIKLSQTNIVGENGVSVQSIVKDRNGNPDRAVQRLIETSWADFSQNVDGNGSSRAEFEQTIIQACGIDGEVFVVPNISAAHKYGVTFSLVDASLCPHNYYDPNKNIINGVEFSDSGSPVAYYFMTSTISGGYRAGQELKRVSAENIWHIYLTEWIGQKRGIPWVATSLGRLKDLGGYEEAAIIAARIGASKMGFFETEGDGQYAGEDDGKGNLIMDAEPGAFEQLPQGVKISSWNPDYPHQQFGEFVSAHLRGISVGLGVAHHSLTGDMSQVNYTQGRAALLDERDGWKIKQGWLISREVRRMYQAFITYGVDHKRITFNGNQLREQPEFYYPAAYIGRRWQWVDPKRDIDAATQAVALKVKSQSSIIRELGQDPDSVWEEMARDSQTLDDLGLNVDNSTEESNEGSQNADS